MVGWLRRGLAGWLLLETVEAALLGAAERVNLRGDARQYGGVRDFDREEAVPARGPLDRAPAGLPAARHPDRDPRALHGPRLDSPAQKEARRSRPSSSSSARLRGSTFAERLELAVAIGPETDAEGQAAAARPVERRGLARATFWTRRRDNGVTICPSRTRSVAARAIHAWATPR
jgi:hypothetical protein